MNILLSIKHLVSHYFLWKFPFAQKCVFHDRNAELECKSFNSFAFSCVCCRLPEGAKALPIDHLAMFTVGSMPAGLVYVIIDWYASTFCNNWATSEKFGFQLSSNVHFDAKVIFGSDAWEWDWILKHLYAWQSDMLSFRSICVWCHERCLYDQRHFRLAQLKSWMM